MSNSVVFAGKFLRKLSSSGLSKTVAKREFASLIAVSEEYPSTYHTKPEPAKASSPSVSTLSNGMVVVTEGSSALSTLTLTYPKAGSANELTDEHGAALVNECLNFRSGSGISTLMIMRSIENEGGVPFSSSSKVSGTTLGYTASADKVSSCLPLLATYCDFEKWDVRDAKNVAASKVEDAYSSVQVVLTEQLYSAAYGPQSSMGRPYFVPDPTAVSRDSIISFRNRTYHLNGAVLAATGVSDHDTFCKEVEEAFLGAPAAGLEGAEPAVPIAYRGGEARLAAKSSYAHIALGFDASASSTAVREVLKCCLDLSAPEGISAFLGADGIAGLYTGGTGAGDAMTDSLCSVLKAAPSTEVIERAKQLAKANAVFAYESGTSKDMAKVMTSSIIAGSSFKGSAEIVSTYDAVSVGDVKSALASMLKSQPSLAAVGDISSVPYLGSIAPHFS